MDLPPRLARFFEPGSATQQLAGLLRAEGFRAYLVGGVVRDAFLDRNEEGYDIDIATDARPDAVARIVTGWADSVWLQGQRFGTVGGEKGGKTFEITTFRADVYHPESRKPEVTFADDIETDLLRRDFTVNALALDLAEPDLVDPSGGLADLSTRRLRTPMAPEVSFGDDPLRMLRAARFVATLGFEPEPAMVDAITAIRERLQIISAERIRDELSKLLLADDPSPGLWLIAHTGLSDEFLPELNAMRLEQDPIHRHKDVLAHTIAVVAKTRPELKVRLAALLHDVGKPKTRGFNDNGVTFHHHEVVGARMAKERLLALRYSSEIVDDVTQLVYLHLRFHTYRMGWTDSAVRRYVHDAGPLLDELNELTRCDCTTRNARKAQALANRMDELEARIAALQEQEELKKIRPDLDGNEVMQFLGVTPGPVVGEAKKFLLELRLEEGPLGKEAAYERLAAWARRARPRTRVVVDPHAAPPDSDPEAAADAALEKHGRIARLKAERKRLTARVIDTRDQLSDRRADSFAINTMFSVFERDSAAGGPVLAGAVAFRVFLFQVPYVFVLVAGLGLASSADHKDPSELARDAGIGGLTAQAIGDFGNISTWGRITALVVGGFALFLAARSAVKVLRIIHALVWAVPVVRAKRLSRQAGVFIVLVTIALALATFVGWLRDRSFVGGLVGTILYIIVPTAVWLIVSWFLPRAADCEWWDLLPGAVVFGVGVEALHVFTVYWIAREVASKSDTYGALGTSLALLFWAYLLGRLIVAAANLNATRWHLLRAREAAAVSEPVEEPSADDR